MDADLWMWICAYKYHLSSINVSISDERYSLSTLPGILRRGDSTTPNSLPSRDYLASGQLDAAPVSPLWSML